MHHEIQPEHQATEEQESHRGGVDVDSADDNSLACDYDTAEKLREAVITMDATFLQ